MKKIKFLLALLLSSGMVLSGCTDLQDIFSPGDKNAPAEQQDDNQGNDSSGEDHGGDQGGEDQGGENQGGEDDEEESLTIWGQKKLVVDHFVAEDSTHDAFIENKLTDGYLAIMEWNYIEFISKPNGNYFGFMGHHFLIEAESYESIEFYKQYIGEDEEYMPIDGGGFSTRLDYLESESLYMMPMQLLNGSTLVHFDLYLKDTKKMPKRADIPQDPNGDYNFYGTWQVYKSTWNSFILNRGILYDEPNYTVAHSFVSEGVTITETFKANGNLFKVSYSNTNDSFYYQRTSNVIENGSYLYTVYKVNQYNVVIEQTENVELPINYWDRDIGLVLVPFNNLRFYIETYMYTTNEYLDPDSGILFGRIRYRFENTETKNISRGFTILSMSEMSLILITQIVGLLISQ